MHISTLKKPLHQRGFTLIELLLALGLMAIFALLAYRGLDSVLRLHQGANEHQQKAQALDRTLTQLEADFRQASSVQFVPAPVQSDGFYVHIKRRIGTENLNIEWLVDQQHLLRRAASNTDLTTNTSINQTAEVLSPVTRVEWLYWKDVPSDGIVTSTEAFKPDWALVALDKFATDTPIKILTTAKAAGIRLTVAGNTVEKYFLIGQ
jgi:prepilin-type N-terminal cleavage/methylation domain-containing protein